MKTESVVELLKFIRESIDELEARLRNVTMEMNGETGEVKLSAHDLVTPSSLPDQTGEGSEHHENH